MRRKHGFGKFNPDKFLIAQLKLEKSISTAAWAVVQDCEVPLQEDVKTIMAIQIKNNIRLIFTGSFPLIYLVGID